MTERLQLIPSSAGAIGLLFTGAMLVLGSFYSYLIDTYKRKYIYMLTLVIMTGTTLVYDIINNNAELWMLCLVQGVAFGVGTTAIITLSIDLTASTQRSAGNIILGWSTRLGMITGLTLGTVFYLCSGFTVITYISAIAGAIALLTILTVHVPFRAPIGVRICSFDRFFLPRGYLLMLNLIFIAFIPGLLIPLIGKETHSFVIQNITIPYFAVTSIGFLLSVWRVKPLRKENEIYKQTIAGLLTILAAMLLLMFFTDEIARLSSYTLLGIGLGLITSEFLTMFVMLSNHCQRGTGNTTHLLGWEIGISLGVTTTCYLAANNLSEIILSAGLLSSALALLFFILITYPYFIKKKVR
jgi:MFS family permease